MSKNEVVVFRSGAGIVQHLATDRNDIAYREQELFPDALYDAVDGGMVPAARLTVPLEVAAGFDEATPGLVAELDHDASPSDPLDAYHDARDVDVAAGNVHPWLLNVAGTWWRVVRGRAADRTLG